MKNIKLLAVNTLLFSMVFFTACKKNWLEAKPDKSLVVPSSITDYQALLDNTSVQMNINQPAIGMVGDGDYYITDATYDALSLPEEKSAYIWAPTDDFYGGQKSFDWLTAYARVLQSNVVLDGINILKVDATAQSAYNNVKGSALFFRSFDYYNLSQAYCKTYDVATAATDLGLPLRVSSNINLDVKRSTLQQVYDQVINDLLQAKALLPIKPLFPTRPSKPAVFGLLSRIYLSQGNYGKALLYADSCLQLQNGLMDYNQLSASDLSPIPRFNKEVIFHSQLSSYSSAQIFYSNVDPVLYQSYGSDDLRASVFFVDFSGNLAFKGTYSGFALDFFGGMATDEMYLNRAECNARAGNTVLAMNDLNTLLQTRWKTGTYTDLKAANADAALMLILAERRKELCFRNLRWTDLRRLNKDPRFQTTLSRTVDGKTYTLLPNSPRYVLPLDPIEIRTGGLEQNPR